MTAEFYDLDREPEDKKPRREPPYLRTGKLAPGWKSSGSLSDWLPSVDAINKRLAEQMAQILGIPAHFFTEPIKYHDPYPEPSE